jgi:hypothetical protein
MWVCAGQMVKLGSDLPDRTSDSLTIIETGVLDATIGPILENIRPCYGSTLRYRQSEQFPRALRAGPIGPDVETAADGVCDRVPKIISVAWLQVIRSC